jgi:hypothetical protein
VGLIGGFSIDLLSGEGAVGTVSVGTGRGCNGIVNDGCVAGVGVALTGTAGVVVKFPSSDGNELKSNFGNAVGGANLGSPAVGNAKTGTVHETLIKKC